MNEEIIELIGRRRRQIIIHSVLYYKLDSPLVEDHVFDKWCRELVELQSKYPQESAVAPFSKEFEDFNGSTGFHLAGYEWGLNKALQLLRIHDKLMNGQR